MAWECVLNYNTILHLNFWIYTVELLTNELKFHKCKPLWNYIRIPNFGTPAEFVWYLVNTNWKRSCFYLRSWHSRSLGTFPLLGPLAPTLSLLHIRLGQGGAFFSHSATTSSDIPNGAPVGFQVNPFLHCLIRSELLSPLEYDGKDWRDSSATCTLFNVRHKQMWRSV